MRFFMWFVLSLLGVSFAWGKSSWSKKPLRSLEVFPLVKESGNLPKELLRTATSKSRARIIYNQASPLLLGEVLNLKIPYDFFVTEMPLPVLGIVEEGKYKSAKLIGEVKLLASFKRVQFYFNKMILPNSQVITNFQAQSLEGSLPFKIFKLKRERKRRVLNYVLGRLSSLSKQKNSFVSQSLLELKDLQSYIKENKKESFSYLKAPFFVKIVIINNQPTKGGLK